ncbi:MAG: hypothetical protein HOC88_09005, partial [Rhodospirillaceae bacterium]|nr:hypothetical protein [Rhodospirillaceae bacterium]
WHFVTLEAPTSWTVYLYGVIAALIAGAFSILFIWLAKRTKDPEPEAEA